MNIINILRKPYLAIFLSSLMLFSACSQYDSDEDNRSFNYSILKQIQSQKSAINIDYASSKKASYEDMFQETINSVNKKMGADLSFPKAAMKLVNYDADKILQQSLENGWISEQDVDLANMFISDMSNQGFDKAVSNYEEAVLSMSLSDEEFAKQNNFLDIIQSVNEQNSKLFNGDLASDGKWGCSWCKCAAASVALVVATAGLASCVTIAACALSVVLVYAASNGFAAACLED